MQIDRRRLLTTATCAVLTGVACAPVARPVEPDGPAAGRFHPLTHALLDRARRAGAGLGTADTRWIERIIHELALGACCDRPLVIKWLASPAEAVDYLDRLGLDVLLDMGATSLWQQGRCSVSPDVKAFDEAFEVRLIANELVDVDECDKTLMAPKLLAKSLAMSAKLPAREVFRVRAVLAQIGWLETSVSDAAAQAVFNVELLLRSGASESSVAIDNQLEVFRAYELGLLATWETPDEVICVPSFRA